MIQGNKVSVIGKQIRIFGIIAADRQTEQFFQLSRLFIHFKDNRTVIPCIGAYHILKIYGNIQRTGCRTARMIVI